MARKTRFSHDESFLLWFTASLLFLCLFWKIVFPSSCCPTIYINMHEVWRNLSQRLYAYGFFFNFELRSSCLSSRGLYIHFSFRRYLGYTQGWETDIAKHIHWNSWCLRCLKCTCLRGTALFESVIHKQFEHFCMKPEIAVDLILLSPHRSLPIRDILIGSGTRTIRHICSASIGLTFLLIDRNIVARDATSWSCICRFPDCTELGYWGLNILSSTK